MTEAGYTRAIMSKLPKEIYKWKIMNMNQNGIPDCYFSGSHGDLWVEVKYQTIPKRESTLIKPNLSPLQFKWLNDRRKEGRNVAVLMGTNIGSHIYQYGPFDESLSKSAFQTTRKQIVEWISKETLG